MSEVKEDLLDDLDGKLDPPAEGAKKAGVDVEDDKDDDSKDADDDDNKDDGDGNEPDEDDELTLEDRHAYLKTEVGRMGNVIGDLTKKLENAQAPPAVKAETEPDPLDAELEAANKLYGPELMGLVEKLVARKVAPLQQTQGIQSLRDRFTDFDDVREDMDKIFAGSPALRKAAENDVEVLDTVYKAAKLNKGDTNSSEQAQKDEARRKKVQSLKDNAHVEKPSSKANAPRKATEREVNDGFVDSMIGSLSNNPE